MEIKTKSEADEFLEFVEFASRVLVDVQAKFENDPIFRAGCIDVGVMRGISSIKSSCEKFSSVVPGYRPTHFDGVQQR